MEKKKKKFRLVDAILSTVCITLVAESIAPTASIGNSQYFWWIFLIIAFVLPYGMISCELGTTYPSEGGMYDWVKKAFGPKWAARVAWNYWVNFPLWIASLGVMTTSIICTAFNIELSIWALLGIQLAYVWITTYLSTQRVSESATFVNIGAIFKVFFMVALGVLGIYLFTKTGTTANPIEGPIDLLPSFDADSLSFISIIIFNVLGLEVVSTFVDDMENPTKEIPKALLIGGALMAIFYLLPATGMNIAVPAENLTLDDGLMESFIAIFNELGLAASVTRGLLIVIGLMFIYSLVANIASWAFGVDSVAKYSADDGGLPSVFSKTNKNGVPTGAAMMNGIVASVIVIGGIIAGQISEDFASNFDLFFCLSWITLLISYVPMFLAFIKLRKEDKTKRVYRVPGSDAFGKLLGIVPFVILILGIVFTIFGDFSLEYLQDNIPLLVGVAASFILEEIFVLNVKNKKDKHVDESKGYTMQINALKDEINELKEKLDKQDKKSKK